MKPKILLVGENCFSFSGNGHMCFTLASLVDQNKYDLRVFAATKPDLIPDHFAGMPFPIIDGIEGKAAFCGEHLCQILATNPVDVVIFVGIDCWAYHQVFKYLSQLHREKHFVWCSIFPYDQRKVRMDWLPYIMEADIPCVYSQFGKELLEPFVPNIQYFRPQLFNVGSFSSLSKEDRLNERRNIFTTVADDTFIFGFVGNNQWRKDPLRLINAFFEVKKDVPNSVLYMHTEVKNGPFNIPVYITDCGGKPGEVFIKQDNARFIDMSKIYNSIDCLVNTSLQEGLSWTLLEAMLCGCPVIAANNTAQIELLQGYSGMPVECTDLAFVPVPTPSGQTFAESKACNIQSLITAMKTMATDKDLRNQYKEGGLEFAKKWVSSTSDINEMISTAVEEKNRKPVQQVRKKAILFAQHSSAGDVLMTTQCFKGIKEKHKGLPLIYMTQPQYMDIVKGNPYIDKIIPWKDEELRNYTVVYNPHGEHILKGRFNRLDVTLHSMYPYFCKVKPDKMNIIFNKPNVELPDKFVIVHTTGGDPVYRTYQHMDMVVSKIGLPCVQIGGLTDKACRNVLDLRGKLSFRETAYVMAKASLAIVIDSFPSHLAGCVGTPVITLFGPAPARVTRPRVDNGKSINLEPNWLDVCPDMGMCWGASISNSCRTPCINTISPSLILSKAKELLK